MKIEDDRREALRIKMGMLKWVSYQIIVFIFFSRFSTKFKLFIFIHIPSLHHTKIVIKIFVIFNKNINNY